MRRGLPSCVWDEGVCAFVIDKEIECRSLKIYGSKEVFCPYFRNPARKFNASDLKITEVKRLLARTSVISREIQCRALKTYGSKKVFCLYFRNRQRT